MVVEPLLQNGIIRGFALDRSAGQKLHLRSQSAADDNIVLVQAKPQSFTKIDFLADMIVDDPIQLFGVRRSLPGAFPVGGKMCDLIFINADRIALRMVLTGPSDHQE